MRGDLTRLRRPLLRAIRGVDHACGRIAGRRRVLVDVRTPMNAAVLRPVWEALVADPRIEVRFAAEEYASVERHLGAAGQRHRLMTRAAAAWQRFDLSMTADAWNHTRLHRCRARLAFFHGVAGKYDLDRPGRLAATGIQHFDRVAFINEDRMRRYLASGLVTDQQAVLVGFPRLDDLVNGRCGAADARRSLGLPPHLPTALYAPTFSTAGSLHRAGVEIVATLLAAGLSVIVKLHDRSTVVHDLHTAGIDWPARLAVFGGHQRFALARGADVVPCLAAADVLVTDHSTVGFEFALLDRPLVVFDVPELRAAARIEPGRWEQLRAMADVVTSAADLPAVMAEALAHPERHRAARRGARALFAHPGDATPRARALVYSMLGLRPPATPAVSPGGVATPHDLTRESAHLGMS